MPVKIRGRNADTRPSRRAQGAQNRPLSRARHPFRTRRSPHSTQKLARGIAGASLRGAWNYIRSSKGKTWQQTSLLKEESLSSIAKKLLRKDSAREHVRLERKRPRLHLNETLIWQATGTVALQSRATGLVLVRLQLVTLAGI